MGIINFTDTHDFLLSIIRNIPYGMVVTNEEGQIMLCNQLFLDHLNLEKTPKALLGESLVSQLKSFPELAQAYGRFLKSEQKAFNLSGHSFQQGHFDIKGRKIHQGILVTTADVSRAKQKEQESIHAIVESQEAERRRLAKEVHDGIGPLMSTIRLNLDAIKGELEDASDRLQSKLKVMDELLQMVASDIRNISHALMPGAIVDFGLVSALENLCTKANESGRVAINFFHTNMDNRLDQGTELGLYRMAQELLNNALKYAKAKTINLQLIRHPQSVVLMVEDDGVGFDPKLVSKGGIGLQNVKTRTQSLGGTFTLETLPGKGVLATVEIPS